MKESSKEAKSKVEVMEVEWKVEVMMTMVTAAITTIAMSSMMFVPPAFALIATLEIEFAETRRTLHLVRGNH
jgi:hypothetical protein